MQWYHNYFFIFLVCLSENLNWLIPNMTSRHVWGIIHFYHLIICVTSNDVSSNSRFQHQSVAHAMISWLFVYISVLFIWKFIMAHTKYDLQRCMRCNNESPPHYICHKQCCFIQLPFPTSIYSPYHDIMIICLYFCIVCLKIYNGIYQIWPPEMYEV